MYHNAASFAILTLTLLLLFFPRDITSFLTVRLGDPYRRTVSVGIADSNSNNDDDDDDDGDDGEEDTDEEEKSDAEEEDKDAEEKIVAGEEDDNADDEVVAVPVIDVDQSDDVLGALLLLGRGT